MQRRDCALLLMLAVPAASLAAPKAPPISFSRLGPGQEIAIDYRSVGCFSQDHYVLRFSRTPYPRLLVWTAGPRYVLDPIFHRYRIRALSSYLGTARLSADQVHRLDNLLTFYRRHDGRGGCTTVDDLTFSLVAGAREVAREVYQDRTCGTNRLDSRPADRRELGITEPSVVSLDRIIATVAAGKGRTVSLPDYTPPGKSRASSDVLAKRVKKRSAVLARRLPGRAGLDRAFFVQDTELGDINMLPYSLHVELAARHPRLVDRGWWFDPVVNEKPRYNWNDYLRVHAALEKRLQAHRWLKAWKNASPGRHIEAHVFGNRPYTETSFEEDVVSAWRHGGLKGRPAFEVLLRGSHEADASVFFGREDNRALITSASADKERRHWLDGMDFMYSPTDKIPAYIVVSPDGTWHRNSKPK